MCGCLSIMHRTPGVFTGACDTTYTFAVAQGTGVPPSLRNPRNASSAACPITLLCVARDGSAPPSAPLAKGQGMASFTCGANTMSIDAVIGGNKNDMFKFLFVP